LHVSARHFQRARDHSRTAARREVGVILAAFLRASSATGDM